MARRQIGILTFHSQLNYGGVLQALALQEALARLFPDDEVVVVDRWLSAGNRALTGDFGSLSRSGWLRFWLRSLLRLGDWDPYLRHRRTWRFVARRLRLTPYHFVEWGDFASLPDARLPDVVVVGSDQVWHSGTWGDPRVYLLRGAPEIRAVAYAASFGMTPALMRSQEAATTLGQWRGAIPLAEGETVGRLYREGLARFAAISCREAEGVEICRNLGFGATHVVDPTLLVEPSFWRALAGLPERGGEREAGGGRGLCCYFLSEDLKAAWPALERFARAHDCRVEVFTDGVPPWWYGPLPRSPRLLRDWWKALGSRTNPRIRVRADAGPEEFVRVLSRSEWVVTDSFHAVMFSIVFARNVRVLRPGSEIRRQMFARIEEFAAHASGPMVADGLDAALASFDRGERVGFDGEWIAARREASRGWIRENCFAAEKGVAR